MDLPEDYIEKLILAGIVEVAGIDTKTGDFLYSFNPNIHETNPEFYAVISNGYSSAILELWTKGYLDINLDEDNEQVVSLNDKSVNKEELSKLPEQEFLLMKSILRSFDIEP